MASVLLAENLCSNRPVIVTGMPFSCGSVVAEALRESGLFLGKRLSVGENHDASNRFVDEEIARFHDEALALNGADWSDPRCEAPVVLAEHWARAEKLLVNRFRDQAVWGWQDPRTTRFLEFWDKLLPEARWLFLVRRPEQVAWSILCRGLYEARLRTPLSRAIEALRLWTSYNTETLAFAQRYPDRTLLLLVPDDLEASGRDLVNEMLIERWSLEIRPVDLQAVYQSHLLKQKAPRWLTTATSVFLPAQRVWGKLADLASRQGSRRQGITDTKARSHAGRRNNHGDGSAPRVCVVTSTPFAHSETFIRAHLRRLPAEVKWIHGRFHQAKRTCDGLPLSSSTQRLVGAALRDFGVQEDFFMERALRRYIRREKIQAVLAEFGPIGVDVARSCQMEQVPLIVHFHGFDAHKATIIDEYHEAYQKMFASAAAIVAVSGDMVEQLICLGASPEKIYCNPCGVDTSYFTGARPDRSPPTFLVVGRFVDKKAPYLTLLAFGRVLESCPQARLIMAGGGPLWNTCRQLTRTLDMEDQVSFLGFQPPVEIAKLMQTVRAFVQHSVETADGDSEGTPVALLEASASGLPVVSTRHAGIKDAVVHGETGFLTDEGDIDTMASYMLELAAKPDLAAALGRQGREHMRAHFSMDGSIDRLWKIIESTIHSPS